MQKVVLSELDTGERVISERVASVRSVRETRAGDTIFDQNNRSPEDLSGHVL